MALPNYLKARVPVPSTLNINAWRSMLADYPDVQLVDHLEFGWPLDYSSIKPPTPTFRNHANATDLAEHVTPFM